MSESKLRYADLRRVKLEDADLRDANLKGMYLHTATLTDAIYNTSTQWPDQFEPKSAEEIFKP